MGDRIADVEQDRLIAATILHIAALATVAPIGEVRSAQRSTARAARTRQIAIYLASVVLDWPCDRVSLAFGRARSTVSHACQRVEDLRERAPFDAGLERYEAWIRGLTALMKDRLV